MVQYAVTANELKMLKLKALSSHPWSQANVGRVVSRIRREFGTDTWGVVTEALEKARITKDTVSWHIAIDPLIAKVRKTEEDKEIVRIAQQKAKVRKTEEDKEIARIAQQKANVVTVVVRRRCANETQEKNKE